MPDTFLGLYRFRLCLLGFLLAADSAFAQGNETIYDDSLQNSWQNWSWASVNLANSTPVHGGSASIAVTADAWEALYFRYSSLDISGFTNFSFWIRGASPGGQQLVVQAVSGDAAISSGTNLPPITTSWQQINVPMSAIVPPGQSQIDGLWIQDRTGTTQPVFYVDDVVLMAGPASPPGTNETVIVSVNAAANVHPINAEIYGVAYASSNQLKELNVPLNRSGGNGTTRYNWLTNASNHASDWYFESLESSSSTPGADGDDFVRDSKNGGAQPMITIPIIGWVAKLGPGRQRLSSYSIAKYGAQTDSDWQWFPDAGNGILSANGQAITNNNPNDANMPVGTNFQAGWVQHLTNRWGIAANGGLRYYIMDNEWGLWHSTHRDVHPVGATMQETLDKFCDYAATVKTFDPGALVVGPEEWGWSGYIYSGYDQQYGAAHGWSSFPDRSAHGGQDYMPWLLNQINQRSQSSGKRLLDVFTLHYYPQGGEALSSDVSTSMQLRRNRSTRSLWDTNYVDETWINDKVMLIPRMKKWVASNYPGTLTGITEYNWGADNHINGATAQADVLGIFGREGLDLATRWVVPDAGTPVANAFKLYRNYDGNKSTFGDTSVAASVPNPDNLSAFASTRTTDGALTVMVINKVLSGTTPLSLNVTNFSGTGTAQVWQLTSANTISHRSDVPVSGGTITTSLPAQSITMFVLPALIEMELRTTGDASTGQFTLWLVGQAGQKYVLQSSTNFTIWSPVSTNTLSSNSSPLTINTKNGTERFYRSVLSTP
jgi:Glycoside hydrolase family 44